MAGPSARRVRIERVDTAFVEAVRRRIRLPDTIDDVQFYERDGVVMALIIVPGTSGPQRVEVLGCPACVSPASYRRVGERVFISGTVAPPLSAVVEDDSRNAVMDAFVLCPRCGRPIVDPLRVQRGVIGVVADER